MKTVHRWSQLALGTRLSVFGARRYSGEDPFAKKGYIMHMVGATKVIVGLLLLLNKWVPFALVLLVPISVNIVMFHSMIILPNVISAALVVLTNGYLNNLPWNAYSSLFSNGSGSAHRV